MDTAPLRKLAALVAVAALAACVAGTPDSRYDAALAKWKGASGAQLVADWGQPQQVEPLSPNSRALTWITRRSIAGPSTPAPVVVAPGVGLVKPAQPELEAPPSICRTRFVLVGDAVVSWTFDGTGCGAPS